MQLSHLDIVNFSIDLIKKIWGKKNLFTIVVMFTYSTNDSSVQCLLGIFLVSGTRSVLSALIHLYFLLILGSRY